MDAAKWAELVRAIEPQLRRIEDEDARAHAVSVIPKFKDKPTTWRGTYESWIVTQARREALRYSWRESRKGLTMRNGSGGYSFLELDSPLEVDGDDDTYHSVIPGSSSPEEWLIAFETLEAMRPPRTYAHSPEVYRRMGQRSGAARRRITG